VSPSRPSSHSGDSDPGGEKVKMTFLIGDDKQEVEVPLGKTVLDAARIGHVDLEGACDGGLACSTCHVIVTDQDVYDSLDEPEDEEYDMLDLAYGLTDTYVPIFSVVSLLFRTIRPFGCSHTTFFFSPSPALSKRARPPVVLGWVVNST
jgi:ferredoxin